MDANGQGGSAGIASAGGPVGTGDRLLALDFIRGVAVLGILFANIVIYGHPLLANSWPGALPDYTSAPSKAVWLAQFVFIDGKMRGLFSMLFGVGLLLFMDRAWARGQTVGLQARRLVWLLLFGLAHFFLLFWGDILYLYALCGLAVLPLLRMSASALLRLGVIWYVVASLLVLISGVSAVTLEQDIAVRAAAPEAWAALADAWDQRLAAADAERAAYAQGSYAAELAYVARHQGYLLFQYPFVGVFETIPLMLIGMALYRHGMFSGGLDPLRLRRWGWAGVGLGIALALPLGLWVMLSGFPPWLTEFVTAGMGQLIRLPMIVGLAALLTCWAPKAVAAGENGEQPGWLGERLVAAGRMAFSNYIGSSLVMMLVFRNWAGGLYGELARPELLAAMVLGWLLMLGWSKWWLARYRYGPLEWGWRCLTYWKLFPNRK